MRITAISDLHGTYPELPRGDLLLVAGDLTAMNDEIGYLQFFKWIAKTPYRKRIVIAGNHDGLIQKGTVPMRAMGDFEYLQDSGTEFEGVKIWGSPWTLLFMDWNFMLPEPKLAKKYAAIPDDIDILITHGPPYDMLDKGGTDNLPKGSKELLKAVCVVKPFLHVFGHIHEQGAKQHTIDWGDLAKNNREGLSQTTFANCSILDRDYLPTYRIMEFEL